MSNHIHLIVQSREGKLSDLIRDFKKFTAKQILEKTHTEPESRREWILERFSKATESQIRNKSFQVWRYGNHAEEIFMLKIYVGQTKLYSPQSNSFWYSRKISTFIFEQVIILQTKV